MVVGMSLYSQIREAYLSGESKRSIVKRLGYPGRPSQNIAKKGRNAYAAG